MFSKELSFQMLKVIDQRKLTLEQVAEAAGLSRKFVGNVVNGKQVPTLDSFEKICSALELEPNDLLLSQKSKLPERAKPMQVKTVYYGGEIDPNTHLPICPHCNAVLTAEHQSYCDACGQKLRWDKYLESDITFEKPRNYKR